MSITDTDHDTAGIDEPRHEPPSEAVRRLDRLVGTWQLSGGASGTVTYQWMPGRHFLLQHVDLDRAGHLVGGMEVIGHLHPLMGERSEHVYSRFYSSEGDTLDYVYELDGDTLTIWGGEKGSPAYFRGTFDTGDHRLSGLWVWPGGGYDATMTRTA